MQEPMQEPSNCYEDGSENADVDSNFQSRDAEKIVNESEILDSFADFKSETECIVTMSDEDVPGLSQLQKLINHSYVNLKHLNPLHSSNSSSIEL